MAREIHKSNARETVRLSSENLVFRKCNNSVFVVAGQKLASLDVEKCNKVMLGLHEDAECSEINIEDSNNITLILEAATDFVSVNKSKNVLLRFCTNPIFNKVRIRKSRKVKIVIPTDTLELAKVKTVATCRQDDNHLYIEEEPLRVGKKVIPFRAK